MSKKRKKKVHGTDQTEKVSGLRHQAELILLLAIGAAFYAHCKHFAFVQDDSFITFRYVRNLVEGHGLVFNLGERVEGYTTFLWTILLALPSILGIDLISAAQLLGIIAGLGSLVLLYHLSQTVAPAAGPWGVSLIAVGLTAANSSIAYWTASGMETALFMLLVVASADAYLRELKQGRRFVVTPLLFVLLSLTRPEGMYLFGLTMLHYIVTALWSTAEPARTKLRRGFSLLVLYVIPIALFTLWRLLYYGYLFPNTYYAKAGFSWQYLSAGMDYFLFFARTYLLHGFLLAAAVGILLWRRRSPDIVYLLLLTVGYILQVVSVGGDVLHAFRFFVPLLPILYLLVQETLRELLALIRIPIPYVRALPVAAGIIVGYLSWTNAYSYVREKWMLEIGLVEKMTETGKWLKAHSSPSTTVAASTIGAISYYSGVPLIDMLGLTDATIAHNPEYVEGVQSGWKERKYNNTYLLGRKPEWIFFSTGIKPSAFAERALFTSPEFRRWYYPCFFHLGGDIQSLNIAYRHSPVLLIDTVQYPGTIGNMDFINSFYDGMNRLRVPSEALKFFERSLQSAPPDFALLHQEIATAYRSQNNGRAAEEAYRRATSINPAMIESQILLGLYARERNDPEESRSRLEQAVRFNPEYTVGWTLLGENHLITGDTLEARRCFEKALQCAPNNSEAYNALARIVRR